MGNENDLVGLKAKKHVKNFPGYISRATRTVKRRLYLSFVLHNQKRVFQRLLNEKGEKACEIDYAPSIETEGDMGYCVLADGFGMRCTVGKQALCGLSMKLATLARPQVLSLSPPPY